jgi:hypothetical protein
MLTNKRIDGLKPRDASYRVFDGGGLYLEVAPAGGKWWRWKYRFLGREKRLSMGTYPEVALKSAREKRDEARTKLCLDVGLGRSHSSYRRKEGRSSCKTLWNCERPKRAASAP